MKEILVDDFIKNITEKDIEEFERRANVKLLDAHKQFLLKHNGGRPEKNCYDSIDIGDKKIGSDIDCFYTIQEDEYNNLYENMDDYEDRIPKGFIPIAGDSCGNVICMGLENSGDNCGEIYFWEHEEETDEPNFDNMYLLANNFTDFINGLYNSDLVKDEEGKYIYVNTYDRYALPFSHHYRIHKTISEFFDRAPGEVEEYIVREYQDNKNIDLHYDVLSEGKRYTRHISEDGTTKDTVEDIN